MDDRKEKDGLLESGLSDMEKEHNTQPKASGEILKHLDLFSGIGGFSLAAQWVWQDEHEIVAFCEIDKFCQKVLRKNFGDIPIYDDIKKFKINTDTQSDRRNSEAQQENGKKEIGNGWRCGFDNTFNDEQRITSHTDNGGEFGEIRETLPKRERAAIPDPEFSGGNIRRTSVYRQGETERIIDLTNIDLLTGGFPCQPFSVAGLRKGNEDDRALWPEMLRIIQEVKPRWIIGENVAGFVNMALDQSITDLENEGYEVQTFIIPACSKNAVHRRDRCWIVANSNKNGDTIRNESRFGTEPQQSLRSVLRKSWQENWYEVAARFCRVDDGVPNRVDRLKSLGNAIVPQVVYEIMKCIKEIDDTPTTLP